MDNNTRGSWNPSLENNIIGLWFFFFFDDYAEGMRRNRGCVTPPGRHREGVTDGNAFAKGSAGRKEVCPTNTDIKSGLARRSSVCQVKSRRLCRDDH